VFHAQRAHHAQQIGRQDATRFGRAGARGESRVQAVDVDRDVQVIGRGQSLAHRVVHDHFEATVPDLVHGVPPHALFAHPVEHFLRRPVTAQPDLHEVGSGYGTRLDQSAHRCAVTGEVAVDDVGGVGVSVEMHHAHLAESLHLGHRGGGRPGDAVIAAEDDGNDSAPRHFLHAGLDVRVTGGGVGVGAIRVAEVDHFEPVEDLDAQIHVVGAGFVRL